jgi:hypothetical protein
MMAQAKLESIKGIEPREWVVRFFFGGAVCVIAGLVAKRFGPEIGGLFLAFPAILPASASMVETHEKRHKARVGLDGSNRGRAVAGLDAVGAVLGSFGLIGFAVVGCLSLPRMSTAAVFALATLAWLVLAVAAWLLRKSRIFRSLPGRRARVQVFRNPR